MNRKPLILLGGLLEAACASTAPNVRTFVDRDSVAVKIDCTPPHAEVSLDGVFQGTCGDMGRPEAMIRTRAGRHSVEVSARGFEPFGSVVEGAGMVQRLTIHLHAVPGAVGE